MPVTTYLNVGGVAIGEVTDGVKLDYLTDALGSVTHLVDQGGALVKQMRYSPYGRVTSRTGTARDSYAQWVGSWGYRATTLGTASQYVRARHFDSNGGGWMTIDLIWPRSLSYSYVRGMTSRTVDPTGLQVFPLFGAAEQWWSTEPMLRPGLRVEPGGPGNGWPGWGSLISPGPPIGTLPPGDNRPPVGEPWPDYFPVPRFDPCEQEHHEKECDELYDHYKKICGGRVGVGVTLPQPPRCDKFTTPEEALARSGAWCSCCENRKTHFANSFQDNGHRVAMNNACRRCRECMEIAAPGPIFTDPGPTITPPGPWV